ncbi:Hypothetical protein H16_B0045 [Cupriavidus necator H16]|uniref:Uncharacterized protein n=1 Tax=Cupriavidus necator (strain ATCC 17699 / DSM 428 / KCTC 22496 / NCIMB 10442 / H16 / Stanier 337) TaxID=381666 RepID=Q0K573_CUPNH|nr:Hypothetical protein H16_B0045 [Cupriavidus necator H16]
MRDASAWPGWGRTGGVAAPSRCVQSRKSVGRKWHEACAMGYTSRKWPRVLEGGVMPVMLIVLALQWLQGLSPPAAALFALPQEMAPADAAAIVEPALTR